MGTQRETLHIHVGIIFMKLNREYGRTAAETYKAGMHCCGVKSNYDCWDANPEVECSHLSGNSVGGGSSGMDLDTEDAGGRRLAVNNVEEEPEEYSAGSAAQPDSAVQWDAQVVTNVVDNGLCGDWCSSNRDAILQNCGDLSPKPGTDDTGSDPNEQNGGSSENQGGGSGVSDPCGQTPPEMWDGMCPCADPVHEHDSPSCADKDDEATAEEDCIKARGPHWSWTCTHPELREPEAACGDKFFDPESTGTVQCMERCPDGTAGGGNVNGGGSGGGQDTGGGGNGQEDDAQGNEPNINNNNEDHQHEGEDHQHHGEDHQPNSFVNPNFDVNGGGRRRLRRRR